MTKLMSRWLRPAIAILPTEPSGPGVPLARSCDARMFVSRLTSASIQNCASWSRATGSPCAGCSLPRLHRDRDDAAAARRDLAADRHALVHERRERDAPAFADVAEPFGVGDAHVGHVDLVELGLARRLHERPHLDARRLHVDDEHRHALVLHGVRVGAREHDAEARDVRERRPHLLAVERPLVAVADRARREARRRRSPRRAR